MVLYEPRNSQKADLQKVETLVSQLNIEPSLAHILVLRGYDSPETAADFLKPSLDQLQSPFRLADMDKAVERIGQALREKEAIVIYGDYDADGVCATSILMEYFSILKADVSYYIPERHREGYGLNEAAVRKLASAGKKLMITVDCGISSRKEVALAKEAGLDVIVTDHHECPAILPDAVAVIDPKRSGQDYDFSGLCGAGVAGRLVEALGGRDAMMRALDLMALATVADLVPLIDENRAIVAEGLKVIHQGQRTGIVRLAEVSGLVLSSISAGQLAFQLGPRINAGGRMDVSGKSVELMTTQDNALALAIAHELDQDNTHRKAIGEQIAREALQWVEEKIDLSRERGIVLWSDHWDSGVQGIVASTLVEKYHRPTVLLTREEDYYVGSARSITGVHLYKTLEGCKDVLVRFGGHEMAAGMAVKAENLELFKQRFNEVLERETESAIYLPRQSFDLEVNLSDINEKLVEELSSLAPSGMGNPSPVMRIKAQMEDVRPMGTEGAHFRANLVDESGSCAGVAFRMESPQYKNEVWYDILVSPGINEWRGRRSLQCQIQHYQPLYPSSEALVSSVDKVLWCSNLFSQLLLAGEDHAQLEAIQFESTVSWLQNAFGTLILAHSPETLKDMDIRFLHVETETCTRCIASQNTLVLAPDYEKLSASGMKWQRLLLLDAPICQESAKNLAEELHCSQIGIIMKSNLNENRVEWPEFGEDALRQYFVSLRRMLAAGGYFRSQESALAQATDAMAVGQSKARIVLRIFSDLGLVAFSAEAPYLAMIPGKKVNLTDSQLYRRCLGIFRQ